MDSNGKRNRDNALNGISQFFSKHIYISYLFKMFYNTSLKNLKINKNFQISQIFS